MLLTKPTADDTWSFINYNSNNLIQGNAFESLACEMAAILSRPQCVQNELYAINTDRVTEELVWHNLYKNQLWFLRYFVMGIVINYYMITSVYGYTGLQCIKWILQSFSFFSAFLPNQKTFLSEYMKDDRNETSLLRGLTLIKIFLNHQQQIIVVLFCQHFHFGRYAKIF